MKHYLKYYLDIELEIKKKPVRFANHGHRHPERKMKEQVGTQTMLVNGTQHAKLFSRYKVKARHNIF